MTPRPVLIVTDPRWTACVPAGSWRRNVIGGLAALDREVELCSPEDLPDRLQHSPLPNAVVAESVDALDLLEAAPGWRENLWLPIFPSAPHDWPEGADWVELARSAEPRITGFLTDSELSRDEIELALQDRRTEVVVLPAGVQPLRGGVPVARPAELGDPADLDGAVEGGKPPEGDTQPTSTGAEDSQLAGLVELARMPEDFADGHWWSFAAAKVLPPDQFAVERSSWDFNENSWPGAALEGPRLADQEAFTAGLRRLTATLPADADPIRTAVLGPQLSFIDQLSAELTRRRVATVETDEWPYLSGPGGGNTRTPELLESSRVVIAEWARPNGKWIQEHATEEHRLIVRAHRYEVTTDFPSRLDMDRYFAAVVITPWVGRTLVQKYGWPPEKLVFIPNYVDGAHFRRPKFPGSEFSLGMVGVRPGLKRLDLALDLLRALRQEDPRYTLRLRGPEPPGRPHWEHPHVRRQWGRCLQRVQQDRYLRNAVFFDGAGRDMSRWYRQIGIILSLSDLEGSHVSLAEGVASGAVPVARAWPGITTLWPEEIVTPSVPSAVQRVLEARDPQARAAWRRSVAELAQLDGDRVLSAWERLIQGDLAGAQARFGPVDWTVPPMTPLPPLSVHDRP